MTWDPHDNVTYIETEWRASELQSMKPNWSLNQCHDWLDSNETYLRGKVKEAGRELILALLEEG